MDDLIAQNTAAAGSKKKKKVADVEALMGDDRFRSMFEDEEFKRDPTQEAQRRQVSNIASNFKLITSHKIDAHGTEIDGFVCCR